MIHATIESSYTGIYPARAVQFFKDYHSQDNLLKRDQRGAVLVMERDGVLVATGSRVENEISGVFVQPGKQRLGLGKMIMAELEKRAVRSGCTEVTLSVSLPSRAFYESLGYELIDFFQRDVGEGQQLGYWLARKTITG
jgi:GNAT superfamily N-acetyltransferase